jgi:hypothetical protein
MPRQPSPLPVGLARTFRFDEARARGVSAGRLRAADLVAPFRGIRILPAAPVAPSDGAYPLDEIVRAAVTGRARALALVLPEHAFFTGDTALALHGASLLNAGRTQHGDLEVAVLAPHRNLRRPGVSSSQVHRALAHVTVVDGLRVATPATAWAMLARHLSERDLVRVGDAVARIPRDDRGRRRPELQLATLEQLRAAVDAGVRRGSPKLRAALERITPHSMSMLETDWRENLRGSGLPEAALDFEIRDDRGILLGIADGAFPIYRVACEIQGDHHRVTRAQWNRDIDKLAAYRAAGWEPVQMTSTHIRAHRGRDVALVRDALMRQGWRP